MAKVSLRIYNREIEQLIEQGQIDEAIAHCRHILKTFPKHLETYRVLGKAYLEARRYDEVVDIFSRLLTAVPDDFVAHVGLSIIRDEEQKIEDAIWHMERAFEAQPSNPAIQGELQRLYGRRDGMEPPKIRMTRGALARVYVQGELYPQAITEIRGVLADDPQRADMQVLLAYSYFKSGQKADASDLCNQLLKRHPYCFDANRIMIDLLPATTGTAESTQVYRMRVGELDPYANFAKGSIFQVAEVSDASISLERLEYTGEESEGWDRSSLGISLAEAAGGLASQAPQASAMPAQAAPAGDEIPDFLRAAGWGESSGPEQPASIFDEEESAAGGELAPADLPDWLKEQAPEAAEADISPASEPRSENIETPDWLSGLGGEEQPSPTAEADAPDWLSGLGGAQSETPAGEKSADVPDWLSGLGETEMEQPAGVETPQEEQLAEPADIPDWLKGAEPKNAAPEASAEASGASAEEQDDAIAWLESLAAKHGAKPEELVTDPNKRSETPPEWVAKAQSTGAEQPAAAPAPSADSLGTSAQDQDDAIAWLESLAAKHGAKPEELVTDPNKRSETPPEWVAKAQSVGEVQPATELEETEWVEGAQDVGEQFFAEFEKGSSSASATDETGMWLRDLEDKKDAEGEVLERGEIPDWLKEPSASEGAPRETVSSDDVMANQDLSEWLSGLDEEPGLPFDSEIMQGSQRAPFSSDAEVQAEKPDLPSWLMDEESSGPAEAEDEDIAETPVSLEADLPEWLRGMDGEQPSLEVEAEEETPPAQPKPTSPSDWQPVVEKPAAEKPVKEKPAPKERLVVQSPPTPEPVEKKKEAPAKKTAPPRKAEPAQGGVGLLNQAQAELERGDIPEALLHYGKLIKKGRHLEEIITHLTDSLYRYPVEVGIWQALGDAYMRANRLKEALDAYNKAEELIR